MKRYNLLASVARYTVRSAKCVNLICSCLFVILMLASSGVSAQSSYEAARLFTSDLN